MSDIKTVNGIDVSWGSMKLKIGGEIFYGHTSVNWGHKLTESVGYSSKRSQAPDRRSRGKYETDPLKVKMYFSMAQALRAKLKAMSTDGTNYGEPEFAGVLQYIEETSNQSHMVEFFRLRYVTETSANEEGPDLAMVEVELKPLLIKVDGAYLCANPDND